MREIEASLLWLAIGGLAGAGPTGGSADGGFIDATAASGMQGVSTGRARLADVDGDGWPDAVAQAANPRGVPPTIFLNRPGTDGDGPPRRFERFDGHGLPVLFPLDLVVFADLDSDGAPDALVTRFRMDESIDPPRDRDYRTAWHRGLGGGRFGQEQPLNYATYTTTTSAAIGDLNADGMLDLVLGNWYVEPGSSFEAVRNDRLLQRFDRHGNRRFIGAPMEPPAEMLNETLDQAGRPTYGVVVAHLGERSWRVPDVLMLNYGRRWNRLWAVEDAAERPAPGLLLPRTDLGAEAGVAGDEITHGRYAPFMAELQRRDPRFRQFKDEKPFRSNGNTFDAAVGDIDNDGDFDLFLTEITHAYAGASSDRSRFLVNQLAETGRARFVTPDRLRVDRIPDPPPPGDAAEPAIERWNQGDLFAELADLNHDGRLDLVLASGDYPDPAPHDERLRIFLQAEDGTFEDATADLGLDHLGCGQISLGDVDRDGDLDILAGQSFARMPPEMRLQMSVANGSARLVPAAAPEGESPDDPALDGLRPAPLEGRPAPLLRLFLNESTGDRRSLVLKLIGDETAEPPVARDALGAVVRVTADTDGDPSTPAVTMSRQLIGVGGHAGKQQEFIVHVGLGRAERADRVEVIWPGLDAPATVLERVEAGRREIRYTGAG